ncbi:MAG: L-idonate 5-dehydrogenase, partial [Chloroflexota bacterium]|nr:L-idonate 5-dehydrogenase [Chloroflexota bacterium]
PFAVALHGVHQVDIAGRRVAVVGIGSLGLCVVEAAVLAGAGEIVAVSRTDVAREAAREAGATETLPVERAGEVDAEVVFETAGAAAAVGASFAAVRRGGRIVVMGGHPGPTEVDLLDLVIREVTLQGSVSHCFADFVAAAVGITSGSLARAPRQIAFAPLESGPALLRTHGGTTKRILVPDLRP